MKTSKELRITGFVIKVEDIKNLALKIYEEYEKDAAFGHNRSINFVLVGADRTQYETKDAKEILSQEGNGILDTRRIVSIEMRYFNYAKGKSIIISLSHTVIDYEGYENHIYVSGLDEFWVKGVIKSFEDIISNWEKQVNWPYKYSRLLRIILPVVIGLIFLITYVIIIPPISSEREFLLYSLIFILGFGMSPLLTWSIVEKFKELYPIVELRTGPEHLQKEVKKRKNFRAIISIVISIINSVVIGVITSFILEKIIK